MPDISMCNNKYCPVRKKCYRFMAKPCEYQSYMDFKSDKKTGCRYFWNMDDEQPTLDDLLEYLVNECKGDIKK